MTVRQDQGQENKMRHCPNCDGEVIVWDSDLQADKCVDCGESWTLEEQAALEIDRHTHPKEIGWWWYAEPQPNED